MQDLDTTVLDNSEKLFGTCKHFSNALTYPEMHFFMQYCEIRTNFYHPFIRES